MAKFIKNKILKSFPALLATSGQCKEDELNEYLVINGISIQSNG